MTDMPDKQRVKEEVERRMARAFLCGAITPEQTRGLLDGADGEKERMEYTLTFSNNSRLRIFSWGDWHYDMTLQHDKNSINFDRMKNKAPLLWAHDHRAPIGVVLDAWTDGTTGHAKVRFSSNAHAMEVKKMVDEGTLSKISVGFDIDVQECIEEEHKTGEPEVTHCVAKKWTPMEISIVSIPMNDEVGIRHQFGLTERKLINKKGVDEMPEETKPASVVITEEQMAQHGKDSAASAVEDYRKYLQNLDSVVELGRRHNRIPDGELAKMRRDAEDKGMSASELSNQIVERLEELSKTDPASANPHSKLDLSPKELRRFSLAKAISYLMDGEAKEKDIGFELECSRAIRKLARPDDDPDTREVNGSAVPVIAIPYEIQQRAGVVPHQHDLDTTAASTGDHIIGDVYRPDLFIPNLRDMAMVLQAGVRVIEGMNFQTLTIPRQITSGGFTFKALDADTGTSDPTFDDIELSVKTASSGIAFSRMLRKLGNPSIEAIAMQDLVRSAALLIDNAVINGSGAANNPTGIRNTTGINSISIADRSGSAATGSDPLTWAEVVDFETQLAIDNALPIGSPVWFMQPSRKAQFRTTPKVGTTFPVFMMGDDNMLNGYNVYCKTDNVLGTRLLFGIFSEVLLGTWGMFELSRDTATNVASGGTVLRAWIDIDVAVRHPVSFALSSV